MSKKLNLSVNVLADLDAVVKAKVEGKYGNTVTSIATDCGVIMVGRDGMDITFSMDCIGEYSFPVTDDLTGHGIVDYINNLFSDDIPDVSVPIAGVILEDESRENGVVLRVTDNCLYVYLNNRRLLVFDRRTGEVRKGLCKYQGDALKCRIVCINLVNDCFESLNVATTFRLFSPEQPLVDDVYGFVKEWGISVFNPYKTDDCE